MWGLKKREELGITPRVLTSSTGRTELPLTEMETALGEDGNSGMTGLGSQVLSFGHGEFEMSTSTQVEVSGRQLHLGV